MKKFFSLFILLGVLVSCQTSQNSKLEQSVFINVDNNEYSFSELSKKNTEQKLKVYEHHVNAQVVYRGYSLASLLDNYYGDKWKKFDGILFTAMDGYRSDVPVEKILKYQPLLAYSYEDMNAVFEFDNKAQNEKNVQLGPFYLVWDNLKNQELLKEGSHGWPYQVAKIEPILYSSYYAKAFPIKNPTPDERRGFELFKTNCMSCHSVSGEEGGAKGPVLYPNPAVIKKGFKSFKKWVQTPSLVKPGTTMPPLGATLSQAEKDQVTKLIYSYLSALNKK